MCQQAFTAEPLAGAAALGDVFEHALGLSAWKRFDRSRWSLRVNPSSGNLHPTEAYVICGSLPGLADHPAVYHYAADRHALELRCVFDESAWRNATGGRPDVVLVALTSIHWREAWKYGERAFRYCQHDLGHAVAAVSFAAALVGWRTSMQPGWSHPAIAAVTGAGREQDFSDAEPEDPGCLMTICGEEPFSCTADRVSQLVQAVSAGRWAGHASQLSEDHVTWSFIDEVARATGDPGRSVLPSPSLAVRRSHGEPDRDVDAQGLLLQRRSGRLRRAVHHRPGRLCWNAFRCPAWQQSAVEQPMVVAARASPSLSIASRVFRRGCMAAMLSANPARSTEIAKRLPPGVPMGIG